MKPKPLNNEPLSPIANAVLFLKESAKERARQEAKELVARVAEKLKECGMDMNVAAPYPRSDIGRDEYKIQIGRYRLYSALTQEDPNWKGPYNLRSPRPVIMSTKRINAFIDQAVMNAAASYDAFVAKLDSKIGPVKEASLAGNHVWGDSILTVVKADGSTERWHTQMIVNVSKYHLLFNQFPTRKLKEKAK